MQYRQEIDGLRTVAVLPVILFHAGVSLFSGGFVGVDVFFVISGYLITGLIIAELSEGRFSIARFYERRARRILPALAVVMACCVPFAWLWMLPDQFADFSKSLIAVPLFVSNILFWRESGYFEAASEDKPLLHTWSLAVEEQYYVVFPILMILLWRFGRNRVFYILLGMAALSLLLGEWGWRHRPSANFFLAPTRAWELLAGALCAFLQFGRPQKSGEGLSALGLALIVAAVFYYDEATPFPSLYALAPVAGTVLIILFAGRATMVARVLSLWPVVAVGQISYSAYLWHQPVFAFARLSSPTAPSPLVLSALTLPVLALAWLSWRFVENPFRRRPNPVLATQSAVFWVSGLVGVGFVAIGLLGASFVAPNVVRQHPELLAQYPLEKQFFTPCDGFKSQQGQATCRRYGQGGNVAVLWGDSHAIVLQKAIQVPQDTSLYVISHYGCPPVIGVRRQDRVGNFENCSAIGTLQAYAAFIAALEPAQVILMARWSLYTRGWWRRGVLQASTHFITDDIGGVASAQTSQRALAQGLERTVQSLAAEGRDIFVVAQPPDLNAYSARQRVVLPDVPRKGITEWHSIETEMLSTLSGKYGVTLADSKALFCDAEVCRTAQDGWLLYSDDNHLSNYGVSLQWDMILQAIKAQRRP